MENILAGIAGGFFVLCLMLLVGTLVWGWIKFTLEVFK